MIKLPLLIIVSWLVLTMAVPDVSQIKHGEDIRARLETEGSGMTDCWTSLIELKSCTNEIVLFLLNGESYLGMGCCRAIRIITHQCWPSMLTSLGFTAQEGDILSNYCGLLSPQPSVGPLK
ncbi:hypothetical protein ACJIZ3_024709 [Penstemon smallii]|uniref:Prolamin-like domain-containing protein n=1 Tax=Penstemon smallii TaxID=265156 RepID=A0ABD3TV55_9LAMI